MKKYIKKLTFMLTILVIFFIGMISVAATNFYACNYEVISGKSGNNDTTSNLKFVIKDGVVEVTEAPEYVVIDNLLKNRRIDIDLFRVRNVDSDNQSGALYNPRCPRLYYETSVIDASQGQLQRLTYQITLHSEPITGNNVRTTTTFHEDLELKANKIDCTFKGVKLNDSYSTDITIVWDHDRFEISGTGSSSRSLNVNYTVSNQLSYRNLTFEDDSGQRQCSNLCFDVSFTAQGRGDSTTANVVAGPSRINCQTGEYDSAQIGDVIPTYRSFGDPVPIVCGNAFFRFLEDVYTYIIVFLIVALIILTMGDFAKSVMMEKEDTMQKAFKSFKTRLIIMIIIILAPVLINFILNVFGITGSCMINVSSVTGGQNISSTNNDNRNTGSSINTGDGSIIDRE